MGKSQLEHNIAIHDKVAKKYEAIHGEIYNEIEQKRLRLSLEKAILQITTGDNPLVALDFGCGAGNLTQHLTDLGCEVVASDVSTGFLDLVASRTYKKKIRTCLLNGVDLQGIADASVDMVATYSVLHHVPDYLSLMQEFIRVLKPGGVVYIDHEMSKAFWDSEAYLQFQKEMNKKLHVDLKKYFIFENYLAKFTRLFINPKYQPEGDIHVFKDDHIEWDEIRSKLSTYGAEIVHEEDYLLYRRNYDKNVYDAWKEKVGDIHLLVARKR